MSNMPTTLEMCVAGVVFKTSYSKRTTMTLVCEGMYAFFLFLLVGHIYTDFIYFKEYNQILSLSLIYCT